MHPILFILLCLLQPRTQALFSMLLAGGRDPSECWSCDSQILGATNMSPGRGGTFQRM
jgi:hypothetical protein